MKIWITIMLLLVSGTVCAQSDVEVEPEVAKKQQDRQRRREIKNTSTYYTLMIHFGNDKDEAYSLKNKFQVKFNDSANTYPSVVKWEEPYFKVYVGKFNSAIEAQKLISQLKEWLPNVILVRKEMEVE